MVDSRSLLLLLCDLSCDKLSAREFASQPARGSDDVVCVISLSMLCCKILLFSRQEVEQTESKGDPPAE